MKNSLSIERILLSEGRYRTGNITLERLNRRRSLEVVVLDTMTKLSS